jgi:hypothetical protein
VTFRCLKLFERVGLNCCIYSVEFSEILKSFKEGNRNRVMRVSDSVAVKKKNDIVYNSRKKQK